MQLDEERRYRCEVRQVLRWRKESKGKAVDYLQLVEKARGKDIADKLKADCAGQWNKGNRGDKGDWRD